MSMPCPWLASGKEDHDKMETMSMSIKKLVSNNMHDDVQACVLFVPCFVVFVLCPCLVSTRAHRIGG